MALIDWRELLGTSDVTDFANPEHAPPDGGGNCADFCERCGVEPSGFLWYTRSNQPASSDVTLAPGVSDDCWGFYQRPSPPDALSYGGINRIQVVFGGLEEALSRFIQGADA